MLFFEHKLSTQDIAYLIKGVHPIVKIGRYSTVDRGLDLVWYGRAMTLNVGRYASIAHKTCFLLAGEHRPDFVSTWRFTPPPCAEEDGYPGTKGDITIGHDVWVGHSAMVWSGITIGSGAVIGGGAVVTRDVPPYAIVAGNPARLVRYRFSERQIERMLKVEWWNWPHDELVSLHKIIHSQDIDGFLDLAEARNVAAQA